MQGSAMVGCLGFAVMIWFQKQSHTKQIQSVDYGIDYILSGFCLLSLKIKLCYGRLKVYNLLLLGVIVALACLSVRHCSSAVKLTQILIPYALTMDLIGNYVHHIYAEV